MGRSSEAEHNRRRRFVLDNYFSIPKDKMLAALVEEFGPVTDRTLRKYYRWAESEMIHEGIFDKDKEALRLQLQRSMSRYQKIADQAAEDEEKVRTRMKKDKITMADCDPDLARVLKDLQYTQINAEKAIVQMLEKAGVTAKREEIDINLKAEWFVTFGQAHMRVAYDLIPDDLKDLYIQRCKLFEGASFDYLRDLVEGKADLIQLPEGGEVNDDTNEEERADQHSDVDREEGPLLPEEGRHTEQPA